MKVAALQMVSGVALQAQSGGRTPAAAAGGRAGAELAVLPEYFCAMGRRDEDKLSASAWRWAGAAFSGRCGARAGLWIVGGTACSPGGDDPRRVYNSSLAFSPAGECGALRQDPPVPLRQRPRAVRRGTHHPGRPGQRGFALPARDGGCGMSACPSAATCAFPSCTREHARAGADLLLVPSAFTHTTGPRALGVVAEARAPWRTWPMCWRRPRWSA